MKSVDALRKWADGLSCIWIDPNDHSIIVTTCDDMPPSIDCVNLREHVNGILDGIEREVEELRDRDYRNGREDAEGAVEFADRLCRASERREDVTLWGVDYTPLPVDADGEAIHVGDVMDSKVDYLFDGRPFGVRALVLCDDGWEAADGRFGNRYEPDSLRHHHAPTVEDMLREFLDNFHDASCIEVEADVVAEYAAKLRLAGEDA